MRNLNASLAEQKLMHNLPDARGRFGVFGGRFVPETLMPALNELEAAFVEAVNDKAFVKDLEELLTHYVGRETPLYEARRLSEHLGGPRIFLKREDLAHTGAHKINNTLGQGLLAKRMGKRRIIGSASLRRRSAFAESVVSRMTRISSARAGRATPISIGMASMAAMQNRIRVLPSDIIAPFTQTPVAYRRDGRLTYSGAGARDDHSTQPDAFNRFWRPINTSEKVSILQTSIPRALKKHGAGWK